MLVLCLPKKTLERSQTNLLCPRRSLFEVAKAYQIVTRLRRAVHTSTEQQNNHDNDDSESVPEKNEIVLFYSQ